MTHINELVYLARHWIDNDSKYAGAERTVFAKPNNLFGRSWLGSSMERHNANVPGRWYGVPTTRNLCSRDCDGVSIPGAHSACAEQHEWKQHDERSHDLTR
jgi:hypothetical protein